jgi:asparagine synthase (glutamine-hydrolysing)
MCGICGSSTRDAIRAVAVMNDAQIHRGPDDEGDPAGRISLGARRLSIIDLAAGHQPLSNEDRSVWAVLNGEIYNSPALARRLRADGHSFRSRSDTETLVHLYEDHGDELVHLLEGMFAFAIWDERAGRLLLGRDRFGEKPLFVRAGADGFAFASELSALVAAQGRTPPLDLDALDAFLVLGYIPGPGCVVEGIEQLAPAHLLSWDAATNRCELRRYWTPGRAQEGAGESDAELRSQALAVLEGSVADTLVSDVAVGVLLSGGVDSALIAALVRAHGAQPPATFTVGYDVGEVSELAQARWTAHRLGSEHHELILEQSDVARRVPAALAALDQPLADPALIALHAVAELARRHVKVALGGEGADELFGGYPRYRWLQRSIRLARVLPERHARAGARLIASLPAGRRGARLAQLVSPMPALERHLDWVSSGRRHLRGELYGPILRERSASAGALASLEVRLQTSTGELAADSFMKLDQLHWLPDDILFKADRAGMLNSLEIRAPYLGVKVAAFAHRVEPSRHLASGGKSLLRASLAEHLPPRAGRRRKTAFRVPAARWLRGPLRPLLEDQLAGGTLTGEGFIEREFLASAMRAHMRGEDRSAILWPVMALGVWLDRYAGRQSGAPERRMAR